MAEKHFSVVITGPQCIYYVLVGLEYAGTKVKST